MFSNGRLRYPLIHISLPVITAGSILLTSTIAAGEASHLPNKTLLTTVKAQTAITTEPSLASSWEACVSGAEQSRSYRDLMFFMKAGKLSNAKPWFVSHSRANEKLFCIDLSICEKKFGKPYEESVGLNQAC